MSRLPSFRANSARTGASQVAWLVTTILVGAPAGVGPPCAISSVARVAHPFGTAPGRTPATLGAAERSCPFASLALALTPLEEPRAQANRLAAEPPDRSPSGLTVTRRAPCCPTCVDASPLASDSRLVCVSFVRHGHRRFKKTLYRGSGCARENTGLIARAARTVQSHDRLERRRDSACRLHALSHQRRVQIASPAFPACRYRARQSGGDGQARKGLHPVVRPTRQRRVGRKTPARCLTPSCPDRKACVRHRPNPLLSHRATMRRRRRTPCSRPDRLAAQGPARERHAAIPRQSATMRSSACPFQALTRILDRGIRSLEVRLGLRRRLIGDLSRVSRWRGDVLLRGA